MHNTRNKTNTTKEQAEQEEKEESKMQDKTHVLECDSSPLCGEVLYHPSIKVVVKIDQLWVPKMRTREAIEASN